MRVLDKSRSDLFEQQEAEVSGVIHAGGIAVESAAQTVDLGNCTILYEYMQSILYYEYSSTRQV